MYFSMILNNQVDSYKYLPMNNLTFANKISSRLFKFTERYKKSTFKYLFKINWQIIKIIVKYHNVSYIKNKKVKTNQVHPFELNSVFL